MRIRRSCGNACALRQRQLGMTPRSSIRVVAVIGAAVIGLASCGRLAENGNVGSGSFEMGGIDDLRARRIVYVEDAQAFVISVPGEEPFALSSISDEGDRLLFCRSSGWFQSATSGAVYDLHGRRIDAEAQAGMPAYFVETTPNGDVRLSTTPAPAPPAVAPDTEPSGPACTAGAQRVVEAEPGFADVSGVLPGAERFPYEIVEGARAGDELQGSSFLGAEIAFTTDRLITRLLAADGSILHEEAGACDPERCPGYYYADLIFTVDATQPGTVLIGSIVGSGDVRWFHRVDVQLVPVDGVEPGSFVGTWYDENGNPTYFSDASGWHLTLHVINGAEHCGWQSASYLTLAWPLGSEERDGVGDARVYVRDPHGVFTGEYDVPPPQLDSTLPQEATFTGYRRGPWELWISANDASAVYLVSDEGTVERWPYANHVAYCA